MFHHTKQNFIYKIKIRKEVGYQVKKTVKLKQNK